MTKLIKKEAAAVRLGVAVPTLNKWRGQGRGPAWVRLENRAIRYDEDALEEYVARCGGASAPAKKEVR